MGAGGGIMEGEAWGDLGKHGEIRRDPGIQDPRRIPGRSRKIPAEARRGRGAFPRAAGAPRLPRGFPLPALRGGVLLQVVGQKVDEVLGHRAALIGEAQQALQLQREEQRQAH